MELKNYQKTVIEDLSQFLTLLGETKSIPEAYERFWTDKKVIVGFGGISPYQNSLKDIPNVCLKVPTGGGKTFIAANAIKPIFDSLPFTKCNAVVWLVPSDAILEQTLKTLSDSNHPYREKINTDFSHRVEVYSKNQLLSGQNFNPTVVNEQLSIFVLSYDSFRTSKKDGRKAYQENGYLAEFAKFYDDSSILLADTDDTALIQVIRYLNPVIIVDESHHASTSLSKEMLQNFNPSFVLDLTATPKKESNIISYVDALQLKKENMVKLPVIVYNRHTRTEVIDDAITIRGKLERQAEQEREKSGRYIRPIVLFQAQSKGKDDNTTFEKIKKILIESCIPSNQVAIKTAEINELRGVDLLSEDCNIRYIITINALKEGWDCPFAYVLATVANRTSVVDVEQILGRILRLPYTHHNDSNVLNLSYVVTSSNDFQKTLDRVVVGLNSAGFSKSDYRISDVPEDSVQIESQVPVQTEIDSIYEDDEYADIDVEQIKSHFATEQDTYHNVADIINNDLFSSALDQAEAYEESVFQNENSDIDGAPWEVRKHMNTFHMNEEFAAEANQLLLPQFVVPINIPTFFASNTTLLTKETLSDGFTLSDKDTIIDFSSLDAEIARVDISEGNDAVPKAWKITGTDNEFFREWFNSKSSEKRVDLCKEIIVKQLSKINSVSDKDLTNYVERIVVSLSPEQLDELQQSPHIYLTKIKNKIETLIEVHREKKFYLWLEQGKITCEPMYSLKKSISPVRFTTTIAKSLYSAEEEMNGLEKDIIWEIANLQNIKWWHRNMSRSGFNINGYINAFPDIIAMTNSGKVLVIEPKGGHLENTESKSKVAIGRAWENAANKINDRYRYYMVFRDKDLQIDGAVKIDRFLEIIRAL